MTSKLTTATNKQFRSQQLFCCTLQVPNQVSYKVPFTTLPTALAGLMNIHETAAKAADWLTATVQDLLLTELPIAFSAVTCPSALP